MKALTIYQPYASLIACGAKTIETRSYHTWYTGPLAIHAAQTEAYLFLAQAPGRFRSALLAAGVDADNLPTGAVIATSNLRACVQIVNQSIVDVLAVSDDEVHFGDWTFDRYAWILSDPRAFGEPIPAQGRQRIWDWDPPDAADAVWDDVAEFKPDFAIVGDDVIDLKDEPDGQEHLFD